MKASVIGIVLMFAALVIAQMGKYSSNILMVICTVPLAIFAILVYFYPGKPGQETIDLHIPKGDRLPDEEHLPQWVIDTKRKMERESRQDHLIGKK